MKATVWGPNYGEMRCLSIPYITRFLHTFAFDTSFLSIPDMQKSSKRIKLEKEIFSKSIKDIEKMFSCPIIDEEERFHKQPSTLASGLNNNRLDIFSESILKKTSFDYDCVNLLLMESQSEVDEADWERSEEPEQHFLKAQNLQVPILPSSSLIPGQLPSASASPSHIPFDLGDDYDVFDAEDAAGLVNPNIRITFHRNLERDLKIIDQMFLQPLHAITGV